MTGPETGPGIDPEIDRGIDAAATPGSASASAGSTIRTATASATRALASAAGGGTRRAATPTGVATAHPSPADGAARASGARVEGVRVVAADGEGAGEVQLAVRDTGAETPAAGPLLVAPTSRLSGAAVVSILVLALVMVSFCAAQVGRSLRNPTSHPPFLPRPPSAAASRQAGAAPSPTTPVGSDR